MSVKLNKTSTWQITFFAKGLLAAFFITLIFALLFSLILQYTALSESYLPSIATFIFFISMFLGSIIAAYSAGHKGLLYSTTVSSAYLLFTLLICLCFIPSMLTLSFLCKKIGLALTSGVLGGIIGIGLISS